jgi:hypothetical protein|tara:strand:- start:1856 stop:2779 length:924 start_codon:yes stop_codon:yes gene_type:complete
MFDTVVLNREGAFLESVPSLLYGVKEHQKDGVYYINGYTKGGQQMWVYPDNIRFAGSLPKFHLGDNIKSIGRKDTQRAIENLSDTFGVDFINADVTRFDIGLTIETNYTPDTYYPLMGTSKQYTRSIYKNSLYYRVGQREKSFYNKKKDAKAKGMIIPDFLINKHLTRFELRYLKKVLNQLNRSELKALDLYDEVFYIQMLDNWYQEYQSVKKLSCMQIDKNSISSPSHLADQVMANLLLASGIDVMAGVDEILKQAKALKVFDTSNPSRDYKRAKDAIYKRLSSGKDSELVKELDSKFKEHIQFYR